MREIKFRAWNKKNNQLINWNDLSASAWNTFRGSQPLSLIYEILVARKDYFEVMQFTGLTDKNGREIYEGDFLKINLFEDVEWTTRVRFYKGGFCIDVEEKDYNVTLIGFLDDESEVEIIGNIHENHELNNK